MARYRKIDPRVWNDSKFASLSHEGQRLFLYILTHPSMTSLGAFRSSRLGILEELGLDPEEFAEAFDEPLRKGLFKYDPKASLIFAPNFLKYNPPENPNVVTGWAGALDLIPECPLKLEVLLKAEECVKAGKDGVQKAFAKSFLSVLKTLREEFGKPFGKSSPIQEQEQKQEQEYINHNKQTTEIRYGETTGPDPVCLENSLSENIRDAQDNSCDESKFEDDDSLLTVLEVIKLCSYNRLKVARSQRLVDVVNSGAVSVGMVKECIDITKASNGSGAYFVGCLANAIHEPDRYMTTIQKIRRSAQKEKEAEQFLLEHGDEVF